jgi:cytochrome P450
MRDRGHMDVLRDFAGPFAARTLKLLLGLHPARDENLELASQAFIDGIGNYADDAGTWRRCERANRLVDAAITADWDRAEDGTVLRALVDAGTLSEAELRANVKLFISGGLNEPRDVIATTLHALLADPEQLTLAREDPGRSGEGGGGEPALDVADRDVPARRPRGHRARRCAPARGDPDRRPHRLRQPRRASLGGSGPLRPAPGHRPARRVLARSARPAPAPMSRAGRSQAPRYPRSWRCPASASPRPTCPTRAGSSAARHGST